MDDDFEPDDAVVPAADAAALALPPSATPTPSRSPFPTPYLVSPPSSSVTVSLSPYLNLSYTPLSLSASTVTLTLVFGSLDGWFGVGFANETTTSTAGMTGADTLLVRVAGGWRFQTCNDLAPYVERFVLEGQSAKLSAAALEAPHSPRTWR